ncbi:MAG TPA: TPM domain-containing protein [Candidatus Paceibacterota bacterium]
MKKYLLLSLLLFPLFSLAFTVPEKPTGFIQDYAKILSAEQVQSLETKLEAFEKSTTNEIAIVTIESLDGDSIENVAQEIFTKWGIGKEDKDNGVLLLIALEDRKTRIHTGYGVEGDLTDIGTSYIQSEYITPAFRAVDYNKGINDAVDQMISALTPEGGFVVPEEYSNPKTSGINWEYVFFFGLILLQWIGAILARSKSWWLGGVIGGGLGGVVWFLGLVSFLPSLLLFIFFVLFGLGFDYLVSKTYKKRKSLGGHYPWWIGGGGFGGGSHSGGGGFGGFSGGSSGGGGSSGSW